MTMAAASRDDLTKFVLQYKTDMLGWAQVAYPWGQVGTVLEDKCLHPWQEDHLGYISHELSKPWLTQSRIIQTSVSSGHGIGKSAEVGMLCDGLMTTFENTRGVVTANKADQLKQKTWPELAKWRSLSISDDMFQLNSMSLHIHGDLKAQKMWRTDAVPWSVHNVEGFQGLHNAGLRLFLIFDESSNIPRIVWETAQGALTDEKTEILWLVYGNPTRNTGRFRETHKRDKHRWKTWMIDSRDVPGTNKELFKEWEEDYGEDSDFFRVRVKGEFPRQAAGQLIGEETVIAAQKREAVATVNDALVIGIDHARSGTNDCIAYARRGRDAKSIEPLVIHDTEDSYRVAAVLQQWILEQDPQIVFADAGGLGGPINDHLRVLLGHSLVVDVNFGWDADSKDRYFNKRAEMYCRARDAMKKGGAAVHNDRYRQRMIDELTVLEFTLDAKQRIQLESKESLEKRGEASPDLADAFVLTYAYPVVSPRAVDKQRGYGRANARAKTAWDMTAAEDEE